MHRVWYLKTLFDSTWNRSSFSWLKLITENKDAVHNSRSHLPVKDISFRKAIVGYETVEAEKILKTCLITDYYYPKCYT